MKYDEHIEQKNVFRDRRGCLNVPAEPAIPLRGEKEFELAGAFSTAEKFLLFKDVPEIREVQTLQRDTFSEEILIGE